MVGETFWVSEVLLQDFSGLAVALGGHLVSTGLGPGSILRESTATGSSGASVGTLSQVIQVDQNALSERKKCVSCKKKTVHHFSIFFICFISYT